jgi:hypothetical protein
MTDNSVQEAMLDAELLAIHFPRRRASFVVDGNILQRSNCIPDRAGKRLNGDADASRIQEPVKPEPFWSHELIEHGWNNCHRNFMVD